MLYRQSGMCQIASSIAQGFTRVQQGRCAAQISSVSFPGFIAQTQASSLGRRQQRALHVAAEHLSNLPHAFYTAIDCLGSQQYYSDDVCEVTYTGEPFCEVRVRSNMLDQSVDNWLAM